MLIFAMLLGLIMYSTPALANPACAVCTVGVVAGLSVARKLGVDDGVVAVWSGALLALIGYWTILWFDKKHWNFAFRNPILMVLSLAIIAGVYIKDLTYTPKPILIFYMDPFLFCTLLGAAILIYSSVFYQWMKAKNGGHAHFPFEKAECAYHVYEFETGATKQKRLGVVFAMTTKTIIEQLRKGLKSCGLELISVEPSSLSLGRAFNDSDKEAVGNGGRIYSFFGKDMANFVFLNENAPVLLREVEISGSIPAERRRFEITNCTEFIAKQLERDPFEEAVITGVDADQWIPALEADSKKPVRKWNLSEVYGIDTRSAGEIAAIGASIKFYEHKTPDVDFTKGNRLSAYEFNASLTAWIVAAVLIVLILAFIGKGYWGQYQKEQELVRAKSSQKSRIADFEGLTASQIQSNLDKIKTQNSNLQAMIKYDHVVTPILAEVVDAIPQGVWITKFSYSDVFPGKGSEERSVVLDGAIESGTRDGRDDLALGNRFKEELAKQPTFKRICGANPTIRFSEVAGTSGSQKDSNKATKFTLTCARGGR